MRADALSELGREVGQQLQVVTVRVLQNTVREAIFDLVDLCGGQFRRQAGEKRAVQRELFEVRIVANPLRFRRVAVDRGQFGVARIVDVAEIAILAGDVGRTSALRSTQAAERIRNGDYDD
jgi:hypothetical protein